MKERIERYNEIISLIQTMVDNNLNRPISISVLNYHLDEDYSKKEIISAILYGHDKASLHFDMLKGNVGKSRA